VSKSPFFGERIIRTADKIWSLIDIFLSFSHTTRKDIYFGEPLCAPLFHHHHGLAQAQWQNEGSSSLKAIQRGMTFDQF
jgi:hypothetical protein